MRKFIYKVLPFCLIFFSAMGYYCFIVYPKITGDIGRLGQIPFGDEYDIQLNDRNNEFFVNQKSFDDIGTYKYVNDIYSVDSIKYYQILTIGDSFSRQGDIGFQRYLALFSNTRIGNIYRDTFYDPVNDYLQFLKKDCFVYGQTVLVEIVERNLISTIQTINIDANLDYLPDVSYKDAPDVKQDFLQKFICWLRLNIGYENPVSQYELIIPAFSHNKYNNQLFVQYLDFNYPNINDTDILYAINILDSIYQLSVEKNVHFYLVICPDKFDIYQPFITKAIHRRGLDYSIPNKVLDNLPLRDYIINPKMELQRSVSEGIRDIYRVNDSHFSYIGANILARTIYDKLTLTDILPIRKENQSSCKEVPEENNCSGYQLGYHIVDME